MTLQEQPLSILHAIAQHYAFDAGEFADRFDILWEAITVKTGRIKSFVDLLMAAECALKGHIALQDPDADPAVVYGKIRAAGHDIGKLATLANLLEDRSLYDDIAGRLKRFSVFLRYSLDSYETFFPSGLEFDEAEINYDATIGCDRWVSELRTLLEQIMAPLFHGVNGVVSSDIDALLDHERAMREFVANVIRKRQTGSRKSKRRTDMQWMAQKMEESVLTWTENDPSIEEGRG